jgi:hypothetical protein
MEITVYLITAVVGCTLLGLQVALMLFGLAHDSDVGHDGSIDHDASAGADHEAGVDADHEAGGGHDAHADDQSGHGNVFFQLLSLKALCAFCALFGLTGLALRNASILPGVRMAAAGGAGVASFLLVGWIMRSLGKLTASGTLVVRNAIGCTGSVYLRIPAKGAAPGKVTVQVQGRSMELLAVTDGDAIPTGAQVLVSDVVGEETLKVVPL